MTTRPPRPAARHEDDRRGPRGGPAAPQSGAAARGVGVGNLNLLGRCSFTASVPAAGALRPLRNPDAPELNEDDDGQR